MVMQLPSIKKTKFWEERIDFNESYIKWWQETKWDKWNSVKIILNLKIAT